jgi:hypothetical protein
MISLNPSLTNVELYFTGGESTLRFADDQKNVRRYQINRRSWDAAIRTVQQNLLELSAHVPVSDEQAKIFGAVYLLCGQLTAKKCLPDAATNRQLARKYGISPRTVTNWRKKGCPFDTGQWRVLDWMFHRRYLPRAAKEKFSSQFHRRLRRVCSDLRASFLLLGLPIPDHLREIC